MAADPSHHRIVIGFDGSPFSTNALGWAARQAELTGATLQAVTAWHWPTTYGWLVPVSSGYDPESDARKMLEDALGAVRHDHPEVPIEPTVVEGTAALVLTGLSEGAELLVVGTRGHGQLTGMMMGSVSEHCVTHAHCPVVVVREGRKPT